MNDVARAQDVALVDLLDRVIDRGVVLAGDVTLSVANVDLIYLGLRVLLAPVERLPELRRDGVQEKPAPVVACE